MAERANFKTWCSRLGDPVAVEYIAPLLGMTRHEVARQVREGQLPVHTFRGVDGRVFRMVRGSDVQQLKRDVQRAAMRPTIRLTTPWGSSAA